MVRPDLYAMSKLNVADPINDAAVINLTTRIKAPLKACFNLSRSIDAHLHSMEYTQERAVAGVTQGLIGLGETVTWQARHFGLSLQMTVKITALNFPDSFIDEMVKGPFEYMRHHHTFTKEGDYTLMKDEFRFRSPYGWLGRCTVPEKLYAKAADAKKSNPSTVSRAAVQPCLIGV